MNQRGQDRLVDAAEVRGRTGKIGFVRAMPSDYVIVVNGITEFAEVKSTQDPTAFRFSLLKTSQGAAAPQVLAAGGNYNVYVHRLVDDTWFKVPFSLIQKTKNDGKQSIKWEDLKDYEWNL